jgi:hypothetical protein
MSHSSKSSDEDYFYTRFFSEKNFEKFKSAISNSNIDEIFNIDNPQDAMNSFHSILCYAHNHAFPLTKVKKGYKNRKPWLSESIKKSINRKNNMFISLRKKYSKDKELYYKQYKIRLNKIIKCAERQFYLETLDNHKNNLKKTWQIMNDILRKRKSHNKNSSFLYNNQTINDPKIIANKFNSYFTNVGPTLASKIDKVDISPMSYLKGTFSSTLYLTPTDNNEVFKIIKQMKVSSAGYDNITALSLQKSIDLFLPHLVYLINTSLSNGVFPDVLKKANILPLFKAGNISIFSNYRPISILTSLSKVFEKIFYKRLYNFLTAQNILYLYQFGFRNKHSTSLATLTYIDKIISSLENREYAISIFLDFSKAFDTVDHSILLKKLEFYGVRGVSLSWIKSYLSDRQQYTSYNNSYSESQMISCGVPQGSILGPLLFLIYINDLANVSEKIFLLMFADDSTCTISGKDLNQLKCLANSELKKVSLWLKANRLSLNISKSNFMIFSPNKNTPLDDFTLVIDNQPINRISNTKFLGVIIDDNLKWDAHILHIKNKISKVIGIMFKVRHKLDKPHLLSIYNTLALPHLLYCNIVWSVANKSYLETLFRCQKKITNCICSRKDKKFSDDLLRTLSILDIYQLSTYSTCLFMYKFFTGNLPSLFDNYFVYSHDVHNYNTRRPVSLHPPLFRSNLSKYFIKYRGVVVWNELTKLFDVNVKMSTFKKNVKTSIINKKL